MRALDDLCALVDLLDNDAELELRAPADNGTIHALRIKHLSDIVATALEARDEINRHTGKEWTRRWAQTPKSEAPQ